MHMAIEMNQKSENIAKSYPILFFIPTGNFIHATTVKTIHQE